MSLFNYERRQSSEVQIGNTPLGGNNPIRIQSMSNVSTMDTESAVSQAIRMIKAGAEYVRFTAQGEREARNLKNIRNELESNGYFTPLIADIHFNPKAAEEAAQHIEKVRINPGNFVSTPNIRDKFIPFLNTCRLHNTAIRIGVNHGSLSERILNSYGDTPEGMVESCMEYLRICVEQNFTNVVLSVKASNTIIMIRTVRLLVKKMNIEGMFFPLHLGVTEAGEGEDGRIKSAVGIGTLLAEGIGDTVRVSLSEEPEEELTVARLLTDYISARSNHLFINGTLYPNYECMQRRTSREVVLQQNCMRKDNLISIETLYIDNAHIGGENPPVVVYRPLQALCKQLDVCADTSKKYYLSLFGVNFYPLSYPDLTDKVINILQKDPKAIILLNSKHKNVVGEMRAFMHRLMNENCDVPVILRLNYCETNVDILRIKAAADFGALLTDGFCDGIMLCNDNDSIDNKSIIDMMYCILQAARVRITKTEYISCPGCGRTLFNLQKTIKQIKSATSHIQGLKIAVMGCIVNGPGEMADADYGYVGAGKGKINLYKGKECIIRNIPENDAVERLLELINLP